MCSVNSFKYGPGTSTTLTDAETEPDARSISILLETRGPMRGFARTRLDHALGRDLQPVSRRRLSRR